MDIDLETDTDIYEERFARVKVCEELACDDLVGVRGRCEMCR